LFLERLKDEGRRLKKNVNFINLFGITKISKEVY